MALIQCFLNIAQWVQKWSLNARAQAIRLDPFDTLRRIPTIHFRFLRYFYRSYIIGEKQFVVSIFSQECSAFCLSMNGLVKYKKQELLLLVHV